MPVASLRPGSLAFNPDTPRRLSTPLLTPIDSTPHDAKAGKTDLVGAFVGDAVVGALAVAAATALFVPGVKSKVSEGDVEGALSEATVAITGIEGFPGKAAWAGGVVAADAVAHLPVLGALIPGPAEFIGTAAAVLLASRYYVTKESSPEEDFAAFSATLPGEFPPPGGVDDVLKPASTLADAFLGVDVDVLTEDVTKAPERVTKWFNELENPVETIAPPAAALGAVVLAGQVAHFPLLSLFLPRALEVVGIAQVRSSSRLLSHTMTPVPAGRAPFLEDFPSRFSSPRAFLSTSFVRLTGETHDLPTLSPSIASPAQIISALDRYEGEDFGACVKSDLAAAAEAGGDVVKKVAGGN